MVNSEFFEYTSNTPSNIKSRSDCTTRCIALCTGETYMTICEEQLLNCAYSGMLWRCRDVWEQSVISRGFKFMLLPRRITRKSFIKMLGNDIKSGMIVTGSSGHIAAIDMKKKKVLDTWDSSRGRIKYIYVHETQFRVVEDVIKRSLKV